jgi:hypothetical protein
MLILMVLFLGMKIAEGWEIIIDVMMVVMVMMMVVGISLEIEEISETI